MKYPPLRRTHRFRSIGLLFVVLVLVLGYVPGRRWWYDRMPEAELLSRTGDALAVQVRIDREEARQNWSAAAQACSALVILRPDRKSVYLRGARDWTNAGQVNSAYSLLNEAARRWPTDPGVLAARADFFQQQHDAVQLLGTLRDWTRVQPSRGEVRQRLGDALYANDQLDEAAQAYRDAIALHVDSVLARRRIALSLYYGGWLDGAAKTARDALVRFPRDGATHQLLAEILAAQGDPENREEVEKELVTAQLLDANLTNATYLLGLSAERAGRWQEAYDHFRQAGRKNGFFAPVFYHAARCAERLGRTQEVHPLLERHLELVRADQEVKRLNSVLSSAPGDLAARLSLARAYRQLGRRRDALESYSRVVAQRPADAALQREIQPLIRPAAGEGEARGADTPP